MSMPAPSPRAGLDRLIACAGADQWAAEAAIDWNLAVRPPRLMPRRTYIAMVSQLYHAERATAEGCRRLLVALPDPAARRFVALQAAEEVRHATVYRAYLARLGDTAPIDPAVARAFDGALAWRGPWQGLVVAFNLVLEGEALALQRELIDLFPCPLFRALNRRIARDEARHVAFGRLYLCGRLAALPAEQRYEIYRWVRALWRECALARRGGGPGAAFIRIGRRRIEDRWASRARALEAVGLIGPGEARSL